MRTVLLAVTLAACSPDKFPHIPSAASGDRCVDCHVGIEPIHPTEVIAANSCTDCHGGDGTATTKDAAHVAVPLDYWIIRGDGLPGAPEGFIKDMAPDQLDQLLRTGADAARSFAEPKLDQVKERVGLARRIA